MVEVFEKKEKKILSIDEKLADLEQKVWPLTDDGKKENKKQTESPCPFPQHKGYAELWKKLTSDQQKEMEKNIKVTADNKIEIVEMKKKFSVLIAEPNGKDIVDGSLKDKYGNTGIKWVIYLTGKTAEKTCKEQNKKLFNDVDAAEQFINFFPWESIEAKMFNFVQLFGLEKSGYWHPDYKMWVKVGSSGYVRLSRVFQDDFVYTVGWNSAHASMLRDSQKFPSFFVAYEDL